ncbi:MAG: flagellar basal body P-ring formation chaperone FlgA [Candidatus Hydrogenedentes bacterium]|nr:flagellar basal body P-ring formation chaperone FlgA [Candidatus Hydrogenedentota bacterium]
MGSLWMIKVSNIFMVCGYVSFVYMGICSGLEKQAIRIKEDVVVSSPVVKLEDVVQVESEEIRDLLSDIILCPAPKPGYALEVPSSTILATLRKVGIDEDGIEIPADVKATVKRATIVLSKELIVESLYHYITENMPWDKERTTVQVYPPSSEVVLPEGDVEINWNPNSAFGFIGTGVYKGKVSVNGKLCKTIICRARVEAKTLAVVASRTIPRGATIKEKDITFKQITLVRNRENVLWDVESVIGAVSKKNIPAGFLIHPDDVEFPPVVKKDQIVPIIYERGGIRITGKGRVLNNAKEGEKVRCAYLDSGSEVEGIVLKDGSIKVE